VSEVEEIVFSANGRCHQENLLAQLHDGCCALRAPVDTLESNWAYMVMTALAWNLKAWWALMLPTEPGRWQAKHQEEKRWVLPRQATISPGMPNGATSDGWNESQLYRGWAAMDALALNWGFYKIPLARDGTRTVGSFVHARTHRR
jgi:hypothetical protein